MSARIRTSPLVLLLLLLAVGCNRGDHPRQLGLLAPDIVIHDGARELRLDQYRGKVVVLNFWASWCAPCLAEFPSLIDLQRKNPAIEVLAVSFDQDAAAYRQFLTDNHITGITTILDLSQQSNLAFGTTRPPESYIIGPEGHIRRKFIGPVDWTTPEIQEFISRLERGDRLRT